MNKLERFINLLKEEFENIISKKTGWGKNEVLRTLETAISNAAVKMMEEE